MEPIYNTPKVIKQNVGLNLPEATKNRISPTRRVAALKNLNFSAMVDKALNELFDYIEKAPAQHGRKASLKANSFSNGTTSTDNEFPSES